MLCIDQPDIVCFTEILPKNFNFAVQLPELQVKDYDCFTNLNCASVHRGVVIYVKSVLRAQEVVTKEMSSVSECVFVEIALDDGDKLLVGNVYRSPNSEKGNNDKLNQLLCDITENRTHVLVTGDFNHPEIDWQTMTTPSSMDQKHVAAVFLETVRDTFLFQHVTEPTHYRGDNTPNVLDLVFSNEEAMIRNLSHCAPLGKSHHQVLCFDFVCSLTSQGTREAKYNYMKGDFVKLRAYVSGQDLLSQIQGKSVSDAWSCFKETLDAGIAQFIPRSRNGNPNKPKKPPWGYRAMAILKKKRLTYQRYLETRDGKDYLAYARARNKAKGECRKAVKEHEQSIAREAKKNPKAFFAYSRSKTKVREGVSDLKDSSGEKVSDDKMKANILNDFFCSVFTKENLDNLPHLEPRLDSDIPKLENIVFSRDDVLKKLKNLDPSKSCGPDGLHPRLLKELAEELADPIAELFTISFAEGKLPHQWKDANVTPLFKKGDKSEAGNYRPVSLTSILCKIMEAIVRDSIVEHMEANGCVSKCQHGFLAKRSCVSNLLSVLDKWTEFLDEGTPVDVIYLDFAKAFDSVPHERLLVKLESYGITSHVAAWVRDFLTGRRQRVRINDCFSNWSSVTSGVPQGSVLGPVLFVLYINDLPEVVKSLCEMYADDTKVFSPVLTDEQRKKLQGDLDSLVEWADKWQLRFNADKCKVLHLGYGNPEFEYDMKRHASDERVTLGATEVEKDLGVQVDKDLKFATHIESQVNKANKILGLIRRSYQFLDAQSMKLLFSALVRPHLECANTIWFPKFEKDKKLIEGVLQRATRLIPHLKSLDYEERLKRLDIPSMKYRRDRGDMIEVFKHLNGYYTVNQKLLVRDVDSVTRGHEFKLEKRRGKTTLRLHFFGFRVVNAWNALPASVAEAPNLQTFKSRLDALWKDRKFCS